MKRFTFNGVWVFLAALAFTLTSCEDEDIGRSRKGKGHGYGMKIAEEICRKYGGEFRLRKEGDTAVSSAFMRRNS